MPLCLRRPMWMSTSGCPSETVLSRLTPMFDLGGHKHLTISGRSSDIPHSVCLVFLFYLIPFRKICTHSGATDMPRIISGVLVRPRESKGKAREYHSDLSIYVRRIRQKSEVVTVRISSTHISSVSFGRGRATRRLIMRLHRLYHSCMMDIVFSSLGKGSKEG